MALNFNLSSKRIPTILGLLVLIGGIVAGVILVGTQAGGISLFTKAGPTSTPRGVRITNISDTGFSVSWTTDTSVSGFVRFGEAANSLNKNYGDDRDQISGSVGLYTTHHITLKGLKPNTKYYFKIGTGSQTYDDNGKPWEVSVPKTIAKPAADPITGKVLLASGQPASGVLVYIEVDGGSPLSAQTKTSGVWTTSLSQMRTTDLSNFLKYDKDNVKISIFVQGADLGNATAIITGANKNPVADITLGQNLVLEATPSAQQAAILTISGNSFRPTELTVPVSQVVTVVNNDTATHSAVARNGEFTSGNIAPNSQGRFTAPSTPGDYSFYDNLNPSLETLVGTLKVVSSTPAAITTPAASSQAATPVSPTPIPTIGAAPEATYSVQIKTNEINTGLVATASPEIKLQGPVGTQVKITVHSATEQTTTATIGADGTVDWTPPEGLEPGQHTVTLSYVDANGVTQTYTKTFTVLAQATTPAPTLVVTPAFSASASATPTVTPTTTLSATRSSMPSTASGIPESGVLTPTLLLLTLGIGLFLAGIGWQIKIMPDDFHKR